MRPEHLVQIGSETKAFVSTVMLQLESEGKLSIHDPIGNYLNNLPPLWQSVTIQQILNHTSVIPDYLVSPDFLNIMRRTNSTEQWTNEALINLVRNTKPDFQAGKGWHYSQTNYLLAAQIIKIITQNTLDFELNRRIIEPLHLKNTVYFPYAPNKEILERMAHGYSEYGLFPDEPKDITSDNLSFLSAAGSMLSTAHDSVIRLKALFTKNILPPLQKHELKQLVNIKNGRFFYPYQVLILVMPRVLLVHMLHHLALYGVAQAKHLAITPAHFI